MKFGKPIAVFALIASTLSAPGYAASVIFSCQTESGKVVTFSDLGTDVRYIYGRADNPDLAFIESKRASVTKSCRNDPNGGFFHHDITINHGGMAYAASKEESVDPTRNFMTTALNYNLTVSNLSGRTIAKIRCAKGIIDHITSARVPDTLIGDCE